ncbi:MAG: VWA domain-containing protein [Bacteroidetes bacterium]|nr:VWA domain-containing protein [Bacteroidota bacterium]
MTTNNYIAGSMIVFFWIIICIVSVAFGLWTYRVDRQRSTPFPWLTATLRTITVFLTAALLIAPLLHLNKQNTIKPIVLFLQDNSQSIANTLNKDTTQYRTQAEQLLSKLSRDYQIVRWGFGADIHHDTLFQYKQPATDISQALEQAVSVYGQQNLGAIILATDGRFNQGNNPLSINFPYQGSIYTVALGDSSIQKDLRIAKVYANKTVTLNNQFEIRADIIADRCNGYNANATLTDKTNNQSTTASIQIPSDRYDRTISFTTTASTPGIHHYVISLPAAQDEKNTTNNTADIFVEVINEKKEILLLTHAPHPDVNAIREALNGLDEYNLIVETADKVPKSISNFDAIILHGLPSSLFPLNTISLQKKPLWLILTGNNNIPQTAQLVQNVTLQVNPQNLQNQFPIYNTTFSDFNMPANINAVADKLPPLAVPSGIIKPAPNSLILFSTKGNANLPLWMLQSGTVPSAILSGEGIWRWRMAEYRFFNTHSTIDQAIRQTISFLVARKQDKPFHVEPSKYVWSDAEPITVSGYLLNANNEQINTPEVNFSLTDASKKNQKFSMDRNGNAYKLNLGLRASGEYHYEATVHHEGKTWTSSGSFVVQSVPIEQMETGVDYPLLYTLAHQYSGSFFTDKNIASVYDSIHTNPAIKPLIQTQSETEPLINWKWYFLILLITASAEWLLRKYWLAQ